MKASLAARALLCLFLASPAIALQSASAAEMNNMASLAEAIGNGAQVCDKALSKKERNIASSARDERKVPARNQRRAE